MNTAAAALALPPFVVAIATFRRPEALARVLPEVVRQVEALPAPGSVLVVDNDPDGGAAAQVGVWSDQRVRYLHEPRPGIAAARNAALAAAAPAELLIFVDDDGRPRPGWLATLVEHWARWRSAAVAGPAVARFDSGEPDPWVRGSGVFDRRRRPTGTLVGGASTSNLLLHLPALRARNLTFDDRFGLTGGSDTLLTHALVATGGQIRWCDEAEVDDFHTAARLSRRWVLRRLFRTGNVWSRVALVLSRPGPRRLGTRADLVLRGLVRAARGALGWLTGRLLGDPARQGAGAGLLASAGGMVSGALGLVAAEYRRRPEPTSSDNRSPTTGSAG